MYINFSHAWQQLWTVLVNFGELLENCVFRPNYYFQHSYATSACFGHPGTILDSFGQIWTTFGKLRFQAKNYFHHSYATSACFGHSGTILDSFGQFWTTFRKLRFRAKLLFSALIRNFSMFLRSSNDFAEFWTLLENFSQVLENGTLAQLRQKRYGLCWDTRTFCIRISFHAILCGALRRTEQA